MFTKSDIDNIFYFSPLRSIIRIRNLYALDDKISHIRKTYENAYAMGHQAATIHPDALFAAWNPISPHRVSNIFPESL
jgi:hypothetical protein